MESYFFLHCDHVFAHFFCTADLYFFKKHNTSSTYSFPMTTVVIQTCLKCYVVCTMSILYFLSPISWHNFTFYDILDLYTYGNSLLKPFTVTLQYLDNHRASDRSQCNYFVRYNLTVAVHSLGPVSLSTTHHK